jgi:hypothetical protein
MFRVLFQGWNLWQAAAGASIASDRTSASTRLFKVMPERTSLRTPRINERIGPG